MNYDDRGYVSQARKTKAQSYSINNLSDVFQSCLNCITGRKLQESDKKGRVSGNSDGKGYSHDVFVPDQVRLLL